MFRPPSGRVRRLPVRALSLSTLGPSACAPSLSTGAISPAPAQKIIPQPAGESSSSAGWVLR